MDNGECLDLIEKVRYELNKIIETCQNTSMIETDSSALCFRIRIRMFLLSLYKVPSANIEGVGLISSTGTSH